MHPAREAVSVGSPDAPSTGSPSQRFDSIPDARSSWRKGLKVMDRAIAIEVSHLSKSYDGHRAVTDISFTVYAGEIFGLRGPTGAGKSTTLRTPITRPHPSSRSST